MVQKPSTACPIYDMGEDETVEHVVMLGCMKYAKDRNGAEENGECQSGEDRKRMDGVAAGTV